MFMLVIIAIIIVVIICIYKAITLFKSYEIDFGYCTGNFFSKESFEEDTWSKKEENCSLSNNGKMTVFTNKFYDEARIDLGRKFEVTGEKQVYKRLKVENRIKISCIPFNSEEECISHIESIKKYFNKPDHHLRTCYRFKNVLVIRDVYSEHESHGKVTTFNPSTTGFLYVKKENGKKDRGEVLWEDKEWDLPVNVKR